MPDKIVQPEVRRWYVTMLIERRADWIHIRLPNSATGWIRTDQAGMIGSGQEHSGG